MASEWAREKAEEIISAVLELNAETRTVIELTSPTAELAARLNAKIAARDEAVNVLRNSNSIAAALDEAREEGAQHEPSSSALRRRMVRSATLDSSMSRRRSDELRSTRNLR